MASRRAGPHDAGPRPRDVLDAPDERARPGEGMAEALRALADLGTFSEIEDPVAWQREQRTDRPDPRDV